MTTIKFFYVYFNFPCLSSRGGLGYVPQFYFAHLSNKNVQLFSL